MLNNDNNLNSNNHKFQINKSTLQNNYNLDFDFFPEENLCIVCWEIDGKIILCLNCKFKYCDNCVKKVNGKCCICFRNKIKNNYLHNYDNFYSDDFEIAYSPNFYTACFSVISRFITLIFSCIGVIFIFKISFNVFIEFINAYFFILLS